MQDREFAVVLEGLRSDFRIFNEGLQQLRQDVSKLDKKIDSVHDKLDKKIDQLNDTLSKKIDRVHVQLMDFSDDVKQITNDYEKRITKLEACKS